MREGYSFDNNFARAQRDYDNQTDDVVEEIFADLDAMGLEEDIAMADYEYENADSDDNEPDWDSMNENW